MVVLSIMALPTWASDAFSLWDMKELSKVPKSESAEPYIAASQKIRWTEGAKPSQRPQGVQAVWLHGPRYRGKATKIFAWVGVPKTANKQKKVPGMVLVHGGGGTAFAQWVAMWNRRGYAAIAIDTSGRAPAKEAYNGHPYAGPRYCGDFDGALEPSKDQWTYHAVLAVILAHSYLRSLKNVDSSRIGLTGISWGGYLTCITAAIDTRFKLAIPVYGCGFLGENSSWVDRLNAAGPKKRKEWLRLWDPSHYIGKIKIPVLWVAFTNDTAYPMDSLQKSYRLLRGKLSLCVLVRFGHSHRCGWSRPEIAAFADSFFRPAKKTALPVVTGQGRNGQDVWVTFCHTRPIKEVRLCFTNDTGPWAKRRWKITRLQVKPGQRRVQTLLSQGTKTYYFNIVDDRGMTVSTQYKNL